MTWEGIPIPGGWEFANKEAGARIIIDYITPVGRGLEAWVELWEDGGAWPVAEGNRNLMAPRAAQPFLQDAGETKIPWKQGLRVAFHDVIEAHRDSAITVDLTLIDPKELQWLVEPLVEKGGNTRLIAPGGSGKSILALAVALTVATGNRKFLGLDAQLEGPVLYLDWETNADTHATRLAALCDPIGAARPEPDMLLYQYHSAPLYRTVQAVYRTVRQYGIVMVVIDSARIAGGVSSQSSGEDATLGLYSALRELGAPALVLDHKSKEDIRKNKTGGYGSIFGENLARLQWEYTSYSEPAPNTRTFVLSLEKENNTGSLPPIGYRMVTDGGEHGITSARFTKVKVASVRQTEDETVGDRVVSLFASSNEPMSVSKILDMLGPGTSSATLRTTLSRDERFENVGSQARGRWKMTDDAHTDAGVQERLRPVEVVEEPEDDESVEVKDGWDDDFLF